METEKQLMETLVFFFNFIMIITIYNGVECFKFLLNYLYKVEIKYTKTL